MRGRELGARELARRGLAEQAADTSFVAGSARVGTTGRAGLFAAALGMNRSSQLRVGGGAGSVSEILVPRTRG